MVRLENRFLRITLFRHEVLLVLVNNIRHVHVLICAYELKVIKFFYGNIGIFMKLSFSYGYLYLLVEFLKVRIHYIRLKIYVGLH